MVDVFRDEVEGNIDIRGRVLIPMFPSTFRLRGKHTSTNGGAG